MDREQLHQIASNDQPVFSTEALALRLRQELDKPLKQQDFDLIDEINLSLIEARGEAAAADTASAIRRITGAAQKKRRSLGSVPKTLVAACLVVAVLGVLNAVTLAFSGVDMFSAAVSFAKEAVTFHLGNQEVIQLPTSEGDPYGLRAEHKRAGIVALTPSYIPAGFSLYRIEDPSVEGYSKGLVFQYINDTERLSLFVYEYKNGIPENLAFPNEQGTLQEVEIGGRDAYLFRQSEYYSVIFTDGKCVYRIHTQNVAYDEVSKIVSSYE